MQLQNVPQILQLENIFVLRTKKRLMKISSRCSGGKRDENPLREDGNFRDGKFLNSTHTRLKQQHY